MNKGTLDHNWRLSRIEEELDKLDLQSGPGPEREKSNADSPALPPPPTADQDIYSKVVINPAYTPTLKDQQRKDAVRKITEKYDSLRRASAALHEEEGVGSVRLSTSNFPASPRRVDYRASGTSGSSGHIVYGPTPGLPPPPPSTPSPVSSPRTQRAPQSIALTAGSCLQEGSGGIWNAMSAGRASTLPRQSSARMMAAYAHTMYASGSQEAPDPSRPMSESFPPPHHAVNPTYGVPSLSHTLPRHMPSSLTRGPPPNSQHHELYMITHGEDPSLPPPPPSASLLPAPSSSLPPPPPTMFQPQDCTAACGPHIQQSARSGRLSDAEVLQVEMFYRSHKTEVYVCASHANMFLGSVKSSSPDSPNNDQWVFVKGGVPVLVLDSGDSRRYRKLFIVLAEKGTGFILWKDNINHLSHYKDQHPNFHTMHLSNDHTRLAGFSFDDTTAAAEFLLRMRMLTSDPADDILNLSGSKKKKKKKDDKPRSKGKYKAPNKSDISSPCCFTHITRLDRTDGMCILGTSAPSSPAFDSAASRIHTSKTSKMYDKLPSNVDT